MSASRAITMRFTSVPILIQVTCIILGKHNEYWLKRRSWWRLERQDANYWVLETTRYIHYPHNSQWPRHGMRTRYHAALLKYACMHWHRAMYQLSLASCILQLCLPCSNRTIAKDCGWKERKNIYTKLPRGESDRERENLNYLDMAVKQHVFNEYYSYLMVALKF